MKITIGMRVGQSEVLTLMGYANSMVYISALYKLVVLYLALLCSSNGTKFSSWSIGVTLTSLENLHKASHCALYTLRFIDVCSGVRV